MRYQFQTRNLEPAGLIRALSRVLPALTFTLATLCLDDSTVVSYRFSAGKPRQWVVPEGRSEFHWDRARKKFGLAGDDVYADDDATQWVEDQMLGEALTHWDSARGGQQSGRPRRYNWWNKLRLRDLATERELALYEVAETLSATAPKKKRATTARRRRHGAGRSGR